MYWLGILGAVGAGVYTVSWARTLLKNGNRAGAFWSTILAIVSTATALYYFYQNRLFP